MNINNVYKYPLIVKKVSMITILKFQQSESKYNNLL